MRVVSANAQSQGIDRIKLMDSKADASFLGEPHVPGASSNHCLGRDKHVVAHSLIVVRQGKGDDPSGSRSIYARHSHQT